MKGVDSRRFRTSLPDKLDYLHGDRFLADEDKASLASLFGNTYLSRNHDNDQDNRSPRVIFFGSGFGELLITRFLVQKLNSEGFPLHWWFTVLSDSFRKKMKSGINARNLLDIHNRSIIEVLDQTRPDLLCILEHSYPFKMTTMMRLCSGWIQCPVFMLSARANREWLDRTALFGPGKKQLYKDSFKAVSYAVTDDLESARELRSFRIAEDRIIMGHSLKWHTGRQRKSIKIRSKIRDQWHMDQNRNLVVMLASIHNSEIYPLLHMLRNHNKRGDIRIILAPHISLPPLHASAVLIDLGFTYQRWSRLNERPQNDAEVILVDTYGDLATIYSAADLAYIGGGFDPQYHGHNVVEAIALRIPVIIGPDFSSFSSIVNPLLENQGIEVARDFNQLSQIFNDLLADKIRREQLARKAFQVYQEYSCTEPAELLLLREYLRSFRGYSVPSEYSSFRSRSDSSAKRNPRQAV